MKATQINLSIPRTHDDIYDPQPSPLLPALFSCAIVVGLIIVALRCGVREATIVLALVTVALLSRLPRVLPMTATAALIIAVLAVLVTKTPMPTHLPAPAPIHHHIANTLRHGLKPKDRRR